MVPDSCTTLTRGEDTGEVLARINDIIMVPDSCTTFTRGEDTGEVLARINDIIMVPDSCTERTLERCWQDYRILSWYQTAVQPLQEERTLERC